MSSFYITEGIFQNKYTVMVAEIKEGNVYNRFPGISVDGERTIRYNRKIKTRNLDPFFAVKEESL